MSREYHSKYQERRDVESINAITDRMMIDSLFLSKLLNEENDVEKIIKESGFSLEQEMVRTKFYSSVLTMRAELKKIIGRM